MQEAALLRKIGFFSALFLLFSSAACGILPARSGGEVQVVDLGNGILREPHTGRMWQKERGAMVASYEEAQAYVERLDLGGHRDWRLPTIYELYDLHYLFDLHRADHLDIALEGNYWSGEKDGEGMAGSWEIGDQCEPERRYYSKGKGYVRAVRP